MEKDLISQVPLHRSLTKKLTWGGIPRPLFLINVVICVAFMLLLKSFKVILPLIALHFLFRYFTEKDPDFFDIFLQYLKTKTFFWSE